MADLDALLIVVPVPFLRAVLADLPPGDAPLIFCSQGMEAGSFAFPIDMARAFAPLRPHAVLSGPTLDRKSVVYGKSVSVRVDPGGRRILKKKRTHSDGGRQ